MKTVIFGGRDVKMTVEQLCQIVVDSGFQPSEVVSGGARGADKLGEAWAKAHNFATTGERFYVSDAEWRRSKGAGLKRNGDMADYADNGVGLWDGVSTGTANMIAQLFVREKPVYVYRTDEGRGTLIAKANAEQLAWARDVLKYGFGRKATKNGRR